MSITTSKRIYREFERCLPQLGYQPDASQLTALTNLIDQSMSGECRSFHRATHSLGLIDAGDAILTVAALFHDLVYFQVDGKLPDGTAEFFKPLIRYQDADLYLSEDILLLYPRLAPACEIFETGPGKKLNPLAGLNEFLSSLAAFMALHAFVNDEDLVQIYACIEATIPFRPAGATSGAIFNLEKNVRSAVAKINPRLNDQWVNQTVARATDLGNRDVANFASTDPSWFLATTWLLLPERNPKLRGVAFSVKDYRFSLLKMSEFFDFLKPELIFKSFHGIPSHFEHSEMTRAASENISTAREYIKVKLVALGILEALAQSTGGDINMPVFLGSIRQDGSPGPRMEDFLPKFKPAAHLNQKVYSLLTDGRTLETNFDLRNSPLAAYIYSQTDDAGLKALFQASLAFFNGKTQPVDFLRAFPFAVTEAVASACMHSCPERRTDLAKILTHLNPAKAS